MNILNKTPHAIALIGGDGATQLIEKTGAPVRIETAPSDQIDAVGAVPVHAPPRVVRITNLPPRKPGVTVVVSQIAAMGIAALHPDRTDVVYPGTGPADKPHRGPRREVVAATRLIRAV